MRVVTAKIWFSCKGGPEVLKGGERKKKQGDPCSDQTVSLALAGSSSFCSVPTTRLRYGLWIQHSLSLVHKQIGLALLSQVLDEFLRGFSMRWGQCSKVRTVSCAKALTRNNVAPGSRQADELSEQLQEHLK